MGRLSADQFNQLADVRTSPPTGADDAANGFELGDEVLVTTTKKVYKKVAEASPGNAEWKDSTDSAGGGGSSQPCFSRDISSMTIPTRTTCFAHEPLITGTLTIQGDGTFLVH